MRKEDTEEGEKLTKTQWMVCVFVALMACCFMLGYLMGYKDAYEGQKEYYDHYIARTCYCGLQGSELFEVNAFVSNPTDIIKK